MDPLFRPDPGMRLLVANRGEIARRIIRTADRLGIASVAVFADPDEDAPHVGEATAAVRLGPAALAESYLSIDRILEAARTSSATHVHPGYGFLSERADFARAVVDAGLVWVGPNADAIDGMGSKINARAIAEDAGVPTIPGYNASQDPADLRAAAGEIGYPILVKASAGGGGKGIRVVVDPQHFDDGLEAARDEAARAFGDPAVIVEKYIAAPRHIEVQIAGDRHGSVIDLGTRECSVQRRYQKLLEEAPAPNLDRDRASAIRAHARRLGETMDYDSVGTVEFIVDARTGEHYFLEMNTRIQVEHTVTEEITGLDLIELQLALADGAAMPVAADAFDETASITAIEARITAEDPWAGHVPQIGTVELLTVPSEHWLRWDSAIEAGSEITPHYDSMIGKLIAVGPERGRALQRLRAALESMEIDGLTTNIDGHRWLLDQPEVRLGRVTTRFLDETPLPRVNPYDGLPVASPWSTRFGRRLGPHRSSHVFDRAAHDDRSDTVGAVDHGALDARAPFPGLIAEISVAVGDPVEPGQLLATIEAMKMLHPITSTGSGVVAHVAVEPGTQVGAGQVLITFTTDPSGDSP